MMVKSAKIAPPHSLILIVDPSGGEIPDSLSRSPIASTDSCIAVGCRSDADGDTEFTLGETSVVNPGGEAAFQARLKTPNRKVTLRMITGQTILQMPVVQQDAMVRVWTNHSSEPDRIVVGIG
jgi:hypothetical protein